MLPGRKNSGTTISVSGPPESETSFGASVAVGMRARVEGIPLMVSISMGRSYDGMSMLADWSLCDGVWLDRL